VNPLKTPYDLIMTDLNPEACPSHILTVHPLRPRPAKTIAKTVNSTLVRLGLNLKPQIGSIAGTGSG